MTRHGSPISGSDTARSTAFNYFFPVTDKIQRVANVKAYWEFAAQNRAEGWNL